LWCQVVKELPFKRAPGRTHAYRAKSPAHSATPPLGIGIQSGKRRKSVLLTTNSLRSPRNDAAVSAQGALGTRAFCKLVAAARNPRFGAKPGSAVAVRRRRNMNCYFHTSTVCRMRRETLRIFFAIRAGAPPGYFRPGYSWGTSCHRVSPGFHVTGFHRVST